MTTELLYIAVFCGALLLAFSATFVVRKVALKWQVLDVPDSTRKLHQRAVPLLGGMSIYISFTLVTLALALWSDRIIGKDVSLAALFALIVAGGVVMVGGFLDDRYRLMPLPQVLAPMLAATLLVGVGIRAESITSPLGGSLELTLVPSIIVSWCWLMAAMYTTKLLDGLDGLTTGVGFIGSLVLFCFTVFTPFFQPAIGLLALTLAGACFGFLLWNWHPAKIFLGEGGSLYIGFMLGAFAIMSGSKIATALLIMGIPMLDMAWVVVRRLFREHRSVATADRKHLHYRLLDAGFSESQAVVILIVLSALFGASSLFLRTQGKAIALLVLGVVMILLAMFVLARRYRAAKH